MVQAIIIDNEKKCISLLEKMLGDSFPEIEVVATSMIPEDGIKLIRKYEPDIVFLDIEMPNKNGFGVLEATRDLHYNVIFTTAYQQYAIKAIRYSALDYLLKPIEKEELSDAIMRFYAVKKHSRQEHQINMLFDNLKNISQPFTRLSVATTEGVIFLNIVEILYCEASGGYTHFIMKNGDKLTASKTLKDFEDILPAASFFRIHHSFLINLSEIKRYVKGEGGTAIMTNNAELPVSKRKKAEFVQQLKL